MLEEVNIVVNGNVIALNYVVSQMAAFNVIFRAQNNGAVDLSKYDSTTERLISDISHALSTIMIVFSDTLNSEENVIVCDVVYFSNNLELLIQDFCRLPTIALKFLIYCSSIF